MLLRLHTFVGASSHSCCFVNTLLAVALIHYLLLLLHTLVVASPHSCWCVLLSCWFALALLLWASLHSCCGRPYTRLYTHAAAFLHSCCCVFTLVAAVYLHHCCCLFALLLLLIYATFGSRLRTSTKKALVLLQQPAKHTYLVRTDDDHDTWRNN